MANRRRPVTLRAIADQLGLDVSTVSRVLNGAAGDRARAASGATAQRIRDLATELGYRPNPHATSLRTQRSNLIGVLVPRLSDLVLATIYEGIEEAASQHGLSTFVTNTRDEPDKQRDRTEMMLARRVDGLIFGDAHADAVLLDELAAQGVRFVLVSRWAGSHPSVTCDDYQGGRLAAEHLLDRGHERVAVIAGEPHASTGLDRTAGFVDRYREAGVPLPEHRVVRSRFDTAGGRQAAELLLDQAERPSAIFAVNDFAAIGAAGAARDHGLRLGEDLALVGFNDTPLAAELPIPLTSVRSPMREMGRRAVDLLARVLAGQRVESERLTPTLVARASTLGSTGAGDSHDDDGGGNAG
ncbi:LacI family DNA-binding transcriptional regulator [Goodfellowiella coeruleoviolacea]|uniref:Transcriptional regulator, LacI family n=1 Tax=Goodfellowiella coeruleoviolacea TaxID=334858 RepID=A0AAE3KHF4_9PSEU|nr:substrate-binding domain-containing protein [Goodfellowiella coeruleoviolacea]MCP2166822.1 transcriptional regulator, LacI family [Goodfellowiella coeruleoviolacea]